MEENQAYHYYYYYYYSAHDLNSLPIPLLFVVITPCEPLFSVEHATMQTHTDQVGSMVIFTCMRGYYFAYWGRVLSIYCIDYIWNPHPPVCESKSTVN